MLTHPLRHTLLVLVTLAACQATERNERPLVIAHRGDAASFPENSLSAFIAAADAGADFIELDVHQSKDGVPVVVHDPTLERTTSGTGPVNALDAQALTQLDNGSWHASQFAGERLPTLAQVFMALATRSTRFMVEVKGDVTGTPYPGFEAQVLAVIREHAMSNRVVINTYYPAVVATFRRLAPELPVAFDPSASDYERAKQDGAPPETLLLTVLNCGANILSVDHRYVTPAVAREAVRRGVPIWAWTVGKKSRMRELIEVGVDGILTKHPERLRALADSQ